MIFAFWQNITPGQANTSLSSQDGDDDHNNCQKMVTMMMVMMTTMRVKMLRQLQTGSGPDLLQTSHSSQSNSPKCQNVGNKISAAATIKISFWNLIAKFEKHKQGPLQTNSQKWGPLQIAIRQSCVWSQEKKTLNMALQPTRLVIITPKRYIPPLQQITYSQQKIHKSKRIFGKQCSHVKWKKEKQAWRRFDDQRFLGRLIVISMHSHCLATRSWYG